MICPKCGVQVQNGANMCMRCGMIFNQNVNISQSNQSGIEHSNQENQVNPNNCVPIHQHQSIRPGFIIAIIVVLLATGIIGIIAIIPPASKPPTYQKIDYSKENAAINSSYNIIDTIYLQYLEQMSSGNGTVQYEGSVTDLKMSGIKPKSGLWRIDQNGVVIIKDVIFDDYSCSGTKNSIKCNKKD